MITSQGHFLQHNQAPRLQSDNHVSTARVQHQRRILCIPSSGGRLPNMSQVPSLRCNRQPNCKHLQSAYSA